MKEIAAETEGYGEWGISKGLCFLLVRINAHCIGWKRWHLTQSAFGLRQWVLGNGAQSHHPLPTLGAHRWQVIMPNVAATGRKNQTRPNPTEAPITGLMWFGWLWARSIEGIKVWSARVEKPVTRWKIMLYSRWWGCHSSRVKCTLYVKAAAVWSLFPVYLL